MNKRDILRAAYKVFPKQIGLLDYYNLNVGFQSRFVDSLSGLRVFAERNDSKLDIIDHVQEQYIKDGSVDYLEFGVYRGQTISKWAKCNANPDSRFFGFDTFEGLPEAWKSGLGRGYFSTGGVAPTVDDRRVTFIKGLFQDTVPAFARNFDGKNRRVIHLDADLYTSTLCVLVSLHSLLVPGTILIFDEFGDLKHEYRAFNDYTSAFYRKFRLLAATQQCYKAVVELVD